MLPRITLIGIVIFAISKGVGAQEKYIGQKLGEFNSYHHQVGGEVFVVDENTFLLKKFMYDGNGRDTFFWAGSRPRPGPQGFIVPNELGRTNVLERYLNKDITIRLPDGKRVTDIKWLAVYDLTRLEAFGDIYIPEGFEAPQKTILPRFKSRSERVSSGDVIVIDSKSLLIQNFKFDGRGDVYFWVGVGPQPHSKGTKIPDEHGYMTPLPAYDGADFVLTLPGDMDVFTTDWLALFDTQASEILGHVIIPDEMNVPPSLITVVPHTTPLPNCEQLHRDLQFSWEVFGDVATIEIAANIGEDDYVAFGVSGSPTEPKMVDGDAVVLYRDTYNGYVKDYNLTSYFPCTELVGQKRGVCDDEDVGGQNSYQPLTSSRHNGVSVFNFRRPLVSPDSGDKPYLKEGPTMVIWAMGKLIHLDTRPEPTMHYAWSKFAQPIHIGRKTKTKNCFAFTHTHQPPPSAWKPVKFTHLSTNVTFYLGPDGGPRGYAGLTKALPATGLAWYVDGYLVPELYLRRDTTYKFFVYGGSNPYDPANYHPLIITDEPSGRFSQLRKAKQDEVRIFAGVESSARGDLRPMRGGDRCLWQHPPNIDRRRDAAFQSFVDFRNSLTLKCDGDKGPRPSVLEITPSRSWPDLLYYNSWTGENMGWKLHILDPQQEV